MVHYEQTVTRTYGYRDLRIQGPTDIGTYGYMDGYRVIRIRDHTDMGYTLDTMVTLVHIGHNGTL
jgi:hypothetical protein